MAKTNQTAAPDFSFLNDDGLGGYGQLNHDVMSFPFLRVIQDLSPQIKETKPEYIEGARPGMVFNTITNHIWDVNKGEPLRFIVGKFERYFIEWKPNRGGFAGAHDPLEIQRMLDSNRLMIDDGRIVDPSNGNVYSDTFVYYVLLPDFMEEGVCLLSLSSSQLKVARKFNRNLMSTTIPGTRQRALPHHMIFKLTTPIVKNDKGEWHSVKIDFDEFVNPTIFLDVTEARKELPEARPDLRALEGSDGGEDGGTYDVEATGKF